MKKTLLLLACMLGLVLPASAATAAPKRELRSSWLTTYMRIDWPSTTGTTASVRQKQQAELIEFLDNHQKRNFTGVCLQVRSLADAIYKSSYEPWSIVISGKRGTDPGWDPLAFAVEECHKRGLECYAWVNPFRVNRSTTAHTTTFDKDWISRGILLTYGDYTIFNPAMSEARQHILNVVKEIYTNYDIDGMLFDDYFYPNGIPETSAAGDYQLYKSSGTKLSMGDWRRKNINDCVAAIQAQINTDRPDMRFGISPAGISKKSAASHGLPTASVSSSDWQYDDIYSDPLAWLSAGSIDFISPQIYWFTYTSGAEYGPLCSWWSMAAAHFGRHFYSSQPAYKIPEQSSGNSETTWSDFTKQIDYNRQYSENNAPGSIFYSAKFMDGPAYSGWGAYLQANSFTGKTLVPVVDWKTRVNYSVPSGLAYNSSTGALTWTATKGSGKAIIRYTVYAIPKTVDMTAAQNADGDGIDVKYLESVVYGTSYTIPSAKRSGYWYALCVYDGYGYESTPATAEYSQGTSDKTTLSAPASGATVTWEPTFSWKAVSGATYGLEIATDAAFTNLVLSRPNLTTTSVTVAMDPLTPATKHYWRVSTLQTGKLAAYSDSRTFTTPSRTTAAQAALISPADGADISSSVVNFTWNAVSGCDLYKVQIASDASFSVVLTTLSATTAKASVVASALGTGTFYWRVLAEGPRYNQSKSASRKFTIAKLAVGNYETGYVVKNDPADYETVDNLTVENIWMRNAMNGFGNMYFGSDGALNRGMTADANYVYVVGRDEASSSSDIYLDKYSMQTGERIQHLMLGNEGKVPFYPANDIQRDNVGTFVLSNLSTNARTTPIVLFAVNTETGALTKVASVTVPSGDPFRIDHVGIWGDVLGGNFTVFAAAASGNRLATWTVANGAEPVFKVATAQSFTPSSATTFGIAPRVFPVSATTAVVDGAATNPALYNFTNGKVLEDLGTNSNVLPLDVNSNGYAKYNTPKRSLMFYVGASNFAAKGVQYKLSVGSTDAKMSAHTHTFTLPADGMGDINSQTYSAPVAIVPLSNSKTALVAYSPGNGLSVYHLTDKTSSAAALETAAEYTLAGRTLTAPAGSAVYNTDGTVVAVSQGPAIDLAPGLYIVKVNGQAHKISVK